MVREPGVSNAPTSAANLAATTRTHNFIPEPACASEARRFVVRALDDWGLEAVAEDTALLTAELATNAILHSRGEFTVAVRRSGVGVRVDVHDDRPDRLPVVVPPSLGPLETGTTGRGLILVAAMAARWGYFNTDIAKTVWFEVTGAPVDEPTEPIVEVAERRPGPDAFTVRLLGMPVMPAIASGVQVDETVRELQLGSGRLSPSDRDRLHDLLDRSAAPRLLGRQEAFRASAEGKSSFTVHLAATADEAVALAELAPFLARLSVEEQLEAAAVGPDVLAMRAWINAEVAAQYAGREPTAFPG